MASSSPTPFCMPLSRPVVDQAFRLHGSTRSATKSIESSTTKDQQTMRQSSTHVLFDASPSTFLNDNNSPSSNNNSPSPSPSNKMKSSEDLLELLIQRQCDLADTHFKLQQAEEEVKRKIAANNSAITSLQRLSNHKLESTDIKTPPSPFPSSSSSSSSKNRITSPVDKGSSTTTQSPTITTTTVAKMDRMMTTSSIDPYINSSPTSTTIVSPSQRSNSSPSITYRSHPLRQTLSHTPTPTNTQTLSSCTAASISTDHATDNNAYIPNNTTTTTSSLNTILSPHLIPNPTPISIPHMLPTSSYLASHAGKNKYTSHATNTPSPPSFTHRKNSTPKSSPNNSPSYEYILHHHPISPSTVSGSTISSSPNYHDSHTYIHGTGNKGTGNKGMGNNGMGNNSDWLVVFDSKIGQLFSS